MSPTALILGAGLRALVVAEILGRPLPKAGVFADGQAETFTHNIAHAWIGKRTPRQFTGDGMCVIEAGGGRADIGKGKFYAKPTPRAEMRGPNLFWRAGAILYEKCRLYRRF